MLKISFSYDLPTYDPKKHDPDKKFVLLTYRGIHYAKWVTLDPFKIKTWKIDWD